jgi:MFS superfamily sulfate permease-like transporter
MMVFSVLRWGRYAAMVPVPVVTGFSCGIGAMMIIGQLNTILGLSAVSASNPILQLFSVLENLGQTRSAPLMLGVVAIASTAIFAHFYPRSPGPLIGAGMALVLSNVFHLHEKEVGILSLQIPPLAGFSWSATDIYTVIPSALGLAVVATVNILITSRIVDHFRGRGRARNADPDAELGAYGIANICAGIFGAPVSVGIPARSLANVRCGGTTRVSNIVHALFLLLFLGLGANVLARIPLAALAGVTAYIGFCLLDWSAWARLPKMRRLDCAAFLSTAIGILFLNAALSVAIGWSFYAIKPLLGMLPQRTPFFPIEGQDLNRS